MIFDFRLKVFFTVAERLSFTRAANELFITQPAVTKHIRELEQQLGVSLFKRKGNSIALTAAGQTLKLYANKILQTYKELEFDLSQANNTIKGQLRLGASTTVAQYVLPKILALLNRQHNGLQIDLVTANTDQIEKLLIDEKIDFGIVEGTSNKPQILYQPFIKDEIVLVTRSKNKLSAKKEIKPNTLKTVPLVIRESGSGTLDVIDAALKKVGLNRKALTVQIQLGSTESIKQYLYHSDCAAFLSIHSISKELDRNELSIIDVEGMSIYRTFQFINLRGNLSKTVNFFRKFCTSHYNL